MKRYTPPCERNVSFDISPVVEPNGTPDVYTVKIKRRCSAPNSVCPFKQPGAISPFDRDLTITVSDCTTAEAMDAAIGLRNAADDNLGKNCDAER